MVLEQQNKKRLQHARQETNIRSDDPNFPGPPGPPGGLQPGHPQGASMSPSNSHTGPSPRMPNMELGQQQPPQQPRKPGQKTVSGGASPETGDQIRNPSPAFAGPGGMTAEQYQQMTQMGGGFPPGMVMNQNGQPQFVSNGRQMQFNPQQQGPMIEMMKQRMQPQPGQPGPYPTGWPQQMMNQQMNQVICLKAMTNI